MGHFVRTRLLKLASALLLMLSLGSQAFGLHQYIPAQQRPRHTKRRLHFRRAHWNPVFRPSRDSLLRQNAEIDRMDLPRIQNQAELDRLVATGDLVALPEGETLRIDPRLDPDRRYCRPWTRDFLVDLSNAYYERFRTQIQVNSAVRTVQVQKKLMRHNRNAAPYEGDTASSHLAGITVDIQRRGMTREQISWMQTYLMPLKEQGLIEPEEERRQWVFHVAVSGNYGEWRESRTMATKQTEEPSGDAPQPEAIGTNNTEQ